MARNPTTRALSDAHELYLVEEFGGLRSPGSGNQHRNPLDVRQDLDLPWALGIEGKSTRGKSLSISIETWDKLVEQAHALTPALALRFYEPDNRLTPALDLIVIEAWRLAEILRSVRGKD